MPRSFKRTPALGKCCEPYARHIAGIVSRGSTELGEWTFQPTGEEFLVDLAEKRLWDVLKDARVSRLTTQA